MFASAAWLRTFIASINDLDCNDPAVAAAVAVMVLSALAISTAMAVYYRLRRNKRKHFLIMGTPNSGKTSIFARLLFDIFPNNALTVVPNSGVFRDGRREVHIVDAPGASGMCSAYFRRMRPQLRGIIFVLDGVHVRTDANKVAESLYPVLVDRATSGMVILLACNKQDVISAAQIDDARNALENAINNLWQERAELDRGDKRLIPLTPRGKRFSFDGTHSGRIYFLNCSAKYDDLAPLKRWITAHTTA